MTTTDQDSAIDAPSYKRDKLLLFASVMIFGIGQSILFVLVGPLTRDIGMTEMQFGLMFTLSNIALVFASPYWGKKSDSSGRKPVLILGLIGSFLGTFFLALSLQVGLMGLVGVWTVFGLLLASRLVYSVSASAVYPSANAFMADITSRKDRAKGMALIGGANSLGSIIGPAIGGILGSLFYILTPLYVAAGISLFGAIAAYYLIREPSRHKDSLPVSMKFGDKRIRPFMIMWATFFFVFTMLQFITAFYIEDRFNIPDRDEVVLIAGGAMAVLGLTNVILQVGVLQAFHVHPRILLRICFPAFVLSLLVIGFATTYQMLFLGYVLLGVAFSVASPGISGSSSLSVEPHEQGTASGLIAAATTAGVVFGPVSGTFLYSIDITYPMFVGAGILAIMTFWAFTVKVPDPKDHH